MMHTTRIRTVTVVAATVAAATLIGIAPAARAATQTVVAAGLSYPVAEVTIAQGDSLQLVNLDGPISHDVTSTAAGTAGPHGNRLFASATVNATGSPATVDGVEDLAPGSYPFLCNVHPSSMQGTLVVAPGGSPLPEPPPVEPPAVPALPVGNLIPTPSAITIHGGSLYAASYGAGTVFRMEILDGGTLGAPAPYATGFSSPLGIAFADEGTLFVADSHAATTPGRATAGRVQAVPRNPDGTAGPPAVVVDELPNGRHNTNNLAVHGGRLYITNGNSTDDGVTGGDPEQPLSGTLLSVDLGARALTPHDPALRVEARGMRNLYDVAFRPGTDEAWIPMNGPDTFDPWGEDLLLKADVADTDVEDFGFPGCIYAAPPTTPSPKQNPAVDPATNPTPPNTDACDGSQDAPAALMGLHVSADGLAFGPDGDLYVARFGNFFGTTPVGHDVVRVPIDDTTGAAGALQTVLPGVTPLDLTFGDAGMYVADFSGLIYLIPSGTLPTAS